MLTVPALSDHLVYVLKAHGNSPFYPQTTAIQAGTTTIFFYEETETRGAILEGRCPGSLGSLLPSRSLPQLQPPARRKPWSSWPWVPSPSAPPWTSSFAQHPVWMSTRGCGGGAGAAPSRHGAQGLRRSRRLSWARRAPRNFRACFHFSALPFSASPYHPASPLLPLLLPHLFPAFLISGVPRGFPDLKPCVKESTFLDRRKP